jgi:hypothetical protein
MEETDIHLYLHVQFSILINSSLHGIFASSRGLHQGNLLPPLLFVVVMEALSRMLSRAMVGGYLYGFQINLRNPTPLEIYFLLFANDTPYL